MIPRLGNFVTGDGDSYAYLVESIARFPPQARRTHCHWHHRTHRGRQHHHAALHAHLSPRRPQAQFAAMIDAAGFGAVSHTNLTNGIVAVHSGVKLP